LLHRVPSGGAVIEICSALYAEICFALCAPYPAGDGNGAIFCSMFAKSRLVRWTEIMEIRG